MPFFTFFVIKLKKCLCSKAPNQYLLTESHLDLLTMHPAMVKESFEANLIRKHLRTLSKLDGKPSQPRGPVERTTKP